MTNDVRYVTGWVDKDGKFHDTREKAIDASKSVVMQKAEALMTEKVKHYMNEVHNYGNPSANALDLMSFFRANHRLIMDFADPEVTADPERLPDADRPHSEAPTY